MIDGRGQDVNLADSGRESKGHGMRDAAGVRIRTSLTSPVM